MKHIQLGGSGFSVPVIGQGGVDIGKDPSISYEYNIQQGIDYGMTLIDTAENYGDGLSESIIGKTIKGLRDKVIIATKVSSKNLSFDNVIKSAESSLKRLSIDCIDLYQIHWPNRDIDIEETMRAFETLYDVGKIKFAGFSNFLPMEIEASKHKERSFNGFASNQVEYNLFDRFAERFVLPYCRQHGLSVICYCPLARGQACGEDHFPKLKKIGEKYNKTAFQIALNWLVSQQGIIAIPFSANVQHIRSNAEAADFQMSDEDTGFITRTISGEIIYANVNEIQVIEGGFRNYRVYRTVEEAIENRFDSCPSPMDLAEFLSSLKEEEIGAIKPIRAIGSKSDHYKYDLIEGRVRYWAWVIAFGSEREIPLYLE